MSQLMRVYVAVPEGPLDVRLEPRLQPGPAPCPLFHPEAEGGELVLSPGGLWVLRLPYPLLALSVTYALDGFDTAHESMSIAGCIIVVVSFVDVFWVLTCSKFARHVFIALSVECTHCIFLRY